MTQRVLWQEEAVGSLRADLVNGVLQITCYGEDTSSGPAYYVATSGSDSNDGSHDAPFRTINNGLQRLEPGVTLYVREGTYHEQIRVTASGTEGQPVAIRGYPGDERPVIDGAYTLPSGGAQYTDPNTGQTGNYHALVSIEGSHVVVDGFEIKRSYGRGVRIWPNDHNTIQNCTIHGCRDSNVLVFLSDYCTISNVTAYHGGDYAPWVERRGSSILWPGGIALKQANHSRIAGCTVYNTWGEGIITMHSQYVTIEDCVSYDNYAAQIYIETTADVTVQRCLAYHTNDADWHRWYNPSAGIICANETSSPYVQSQNQTLINNVCVGNSDNIGWWNSGSYTGTAHNMLIAHNASINPVINAPNSPNPKAYALRLPYQNVGFYLNTSVVNNIFYDSAGLDCGVTSDRQIAWSHNAWSEQVADHMQGSGDRVGDPKMMDPNHALSAGSVLPHWYSLDAASWCINTAYDLSGVSDDYYGRLRSQQPDIGAIEYGVY